MSDPQRVRSALVSRWNPRAGSTVRRLSLGFLWGWIYPLSHTWLMPTTFFEQKGASLYMASLFSVGALLALASLGIAPAGERSARVAAGCEVAASDQGTARSPGRRSGALLGWLALAALYGVTWLWAR